MQQINGIGAAGLSPPCDSAAGGVAASISGTLSDIAASKARYAIRSACPEKVARDRARVKAYRAIRSACPETSASDRARDAANRAKRGGDKAYRANIALCPEKYARARAADKANKAKRRACPKKLANDRAVRTTNKARRMGCPELAAADRAAKKVRKATRRARAAGAEGKPSAAHFQWLLATQKRKCAECKRSIRLDYHADHIIPLALGGQNGPGNFQLLCPLCNLRKGAKHPVIWAKENGRLL